MAIARRFLSSNNSSTGPPSVADPPSEVTVESDFVVILAALLCALICVVGLIAVARCAWLRRGGGGENVRARGHPAANKGLKKKVLQSLPKFVYGAAFVAENGGKQLAADCAICLAEYAEGEEIRMLPQCGHGFHVQCIDTWLGSHSSCPSCRQILIVARCRKCGGGEFPPIPAAGDETQLRRGCGGGGGANFLV
ncbi:PREDICTED: RING-H2 finger protein ATL8-like [Ipomoea nil]|uniref:RING-H2 finger protein ATL8-like n=1 Tax=Ipomoea nil TaxID=35883 RepID=UPI0009019D43|nr:PREDICTED: RING-H2 finger protein ATL8-like [Ipomoea nil]